MLGLVACWIDNETLARRAACRDLVWAESNKTKFTFESYFFGV